MSFFDALSESLRLDQSWPMFVLPLLAYPIYIALSFVGVQITRACVALLQVGMGVRSSVIARIRERIVLGKIESVQDALELESEIGHLERQIDRLIGRLERIKGLLDIQEVEAQTETLGKRELELRLMRYQTALFNKDSGMLPAAAVGLETYLSRGMNGFLSIAYLHNVVTVGNALRDPLVQRNLPTVVAEFLGPGDRNWLLARMG